MAEEDRSRRPTVFSALREIIAAFAADDPHLGLYGAFGYDLAFQFEPVTLATTVPTASVTWSCTCPTNCSYWTASARTAIRYRYEFTVDGVSTAGPAAGHPAAPGRVHRATGGRGQPFVEADGPAADVPGPPVPGTYARIVEQARERFVRGDLFEVVPSHVFRGPCASPAAFYQRLRERNPAPYEFFFNLGEGECLVGASPEMYVRVTGDRVETCPISGTIRRGGDPLEDAENIRTLLNSAKEESELTMCTDVDRNDKSRVCVPGSVR